MPEYKERLEGYRGVAHIRKLNKTLRFSASPERKKKTIIMKDFHPPRKEKKFYNNGKSTKSKQI